MVADAMAVWDHVDLTAPKNVPIYLWGHSLGTGVASKAAVELDTSQARMPTGVILESAFYDIDGLITNHPKFAPWAGTFPFEKIALDSAHQAGFQFKSCERVGYINAPLLMLHADDDFTIRFEIGFRLYQKSKFRTNNMPREFYGFVGNRGYEHNRMVDAPEFDQVVTDFMRKCIALNKGSMPNPVIAKLQGASKMRNSENTVFIAETNKNHLNTNLDSSQSRNTNLTIPTNYSNPSKNQSSTNQAIIADDNILHIDQDDRDYDNDNQDHNNNVQAGMNDNYKAMDESNSSNMLVLDFFKSATSAKKKKSMTDLSISEQEKHMSVLEDRLKELEAIVNSNTDDIKSSNTAMKKKSVTDSNILKQEKK